MSTKNLVISISGGRSSAMMARHIQTNEKYKNYNKLFVFANTGREREETLNFLYQIQTRWSIDIHWIEAVAPMTMGNGIEAIEVNYFSADRYGHVFEAIIDKANLGTFEGVPNQKSPYCSGKLKKIPIDKFAKDYFKSTKYITALGMRAEDMPKRITWAEIRENKKYIYPLITDFEYPINQIQVREFWKQQDFNLQISSEIGNCDLCWKKSEKKLISVLRKEPQRAEFWRKMEKKYNKPFYRKYQTIDDLLKKAKSNIQIDLFDDNYDNCLC